MHQRRHGRITIPQLGPTATRATVTPPAGAARLPLGADHHPRGWPRLRHLDAGGRDRLRQRGPRAASPCRWCSSASSGRRLGADRTSATGEVKGTVVEGLPYIGGADGQRRPGPARCQFRGPMCSPWCPCPTWTTVTSDLRRPRQRRRHFDIRTCPNGTYQLTLLGRRRRTTSSTASTSTVAERRARPTSATALVGWFTHIHGNVFIDANGNGKRTRRDRRPAVPADRPRARQLADGPGHEHHVHRRQRRVRHPRDLPAEQVAGPRGVQHPLPDHGHHLQGRERDHVRRPSSAALVDLDFLPDHRPRRRGRLGRPALRPPARNGGIVGTVSYDTTRNELDPADAVTEAYQPGIPDVPVHLYAQRARAPTRPTTCRRVPCSRNRTIVPLQVAEPRHDGDPPLPTTIDDPATRPGALRQGRRAARTPTPRETWAAAARLHGARLRRPRCSPTSAPCPSSARPRTGCASRRR